METIVYLSDKNDNDDIVDVEKIDVRPLYQRERFKRQQQKRVEYNKKKIQHCYESVDDEDDDDIQLIDVRPLHSSERLRLYNEQKALKNIGDDEDDIQIMKIGPVHPRYRLKRKTKNDSGDVKITKVQPQHPRNQKLSKEIDTKTLTKDPLVEINLNRDSSGIYKREDAIFDEILKDIPLHKDKLYIEHDRENNTFLLKEDEKQS